MSQPIRKAIQNIISGSVHLVCNVGWKIIVTTVDFGEFLLKISNNRHFKNAIRAMIYPLQQIFRMISYILPNDIKLEINEVIGLLFIILLLGFSGTMYGLYHKYYRMIL